MTKLEREYLISLRESDQLAAGPELEKAAELNNEATLEKAPSELVSTINNGDVYGDDEEMAEDVGEVVVEGLYNFLMESSDEEFNLFLEKLNYEETNYCINLLESAEILTEKARNETTTASAVKRVGHGVASAAGGVGALHTGKAIGKALAAGAAAGGTSVGAALGAAGLGLGSAAVGYGVYKGAQAIKREVDSRKKASAHYDGSDGKKLNIGKVYEKGADGKYALSKEDKEENYNYATRHHDRKTKLLQNQYAHADKITRAKEALKYAKRDGDESKIEAARTAKKQAVRDQSTDAKVIKNQERLKARLARSNARRDDANVRAGRAASMGRATPAPAAEAQTPAPQTPAPQTQTNESFSDLDLMYMLEEAGYEASLDNLILLKEGFETGEWTVIYECNFTDYELCKILDENGYEVSDENVEILREGFINGTYTI